MNKIVVILLAVQISLFGQKNEALQPTDVAKLDEILSKYHDFELFNGNILIAQKGKVLFQKSYGNANFSWNIPNSADTKFRIGSLTKQFTALVILQLKQEGKISLDGKVSDYLPWFGLKIGKKLTVFHLLTMTSGLANYTDEATPMMERENLSPKDFALKYFKDTLLFEPGTNIRYCNTGYYLLGLMIEEILQKSYESVLQERVFDKLGMKNTGIESANQVIPNLAEGYVFESGQYFVPHSINMKTMTFSAGAMFSTVSDLLLYDAALTNHTLLGPENQKIMFTRALPNYACGVTVRTKKDFLKTGQDKTWISHDGGIHGFSSYMMRIQEDSIFIVMLDNTRAGMRGGDLEAIAENIVPILYQKSAALPKPIASIELAKRIAAQSVEIGLDYFRNEVQKQRENFNFMRFESEINEIAYGFLGSGEVSDAIKLFELLTAEFPKSSNAFDSLGEAYFKNNQFELAKKAYQKSLDLDAKNANAKSMIEKIEGKN